LGFTLEVHFIVSDIKDFTVTALENRFEQSANLLPYPLRPFSSGNQRITAPVFDLSTGRFKVSVEFTLLRKSISKVAQLAIDNAR
jgi:hypothetical protein